MQLNRSWLCMNCNEIFDAKDLKKQGCPRCASDEIYPLTKWIGSHVEIHQADQEITHG